MILHRDDTVLCDIMDIKAYDNVWCYIVMITVLVDMVWYYVILWYTKGYDTILLHVASWWYCCISWYGFDIMSRYGISRYTIRSFMILHDDTAVLVDMVWYYVDTMLMLTVKFYDVIRSILNMLTRCDKNTIWYTYITWCDNPIIWYDMSRYDIILYWCMAWCTTMRERYGKREHFFLIEILVLTLTRSAYPYLTRPTTER